MIVVTNCDRIVDLSADRISARKESLRGELIDHDRSGTAAHIFRTKISPAQHRHTEDAKVIRRNDRHFAGRFLAGRIGRRARYVKRAVPFLVIEWRVIADACDAHARQRFDFSKELIVKPRNPLRRIVARRRQRNGQCQNSAGIESKWHLLRTPETFQGQSCGREKNYGECRLRDDEN